LLDAPDAHERAARDWAEPAPDAVHQGAGEFAAHEVDALIARALAPEVALPGGGSMVIEATRALVAVDVNTGGDTSPAAALKANIAAARALPRELRLRGLGGQVVIDFAPVPKRDRPAIVQSLTAMFRNEGAETSLAGWTALCRSRARSLAGSRDGRLPHLPPPRPARGPALLLAPLRRCRSRALAHGQLRHSRARPDRGRRSAPGPHHRRGRGLIAPPLASGGGLAYLPLNSGWSGSKPDRPRKKQRAASARFRFRDPR
jgi:hypothetical protein